MSFQVILHPSPIFILLTHAGKNIEYVLFYVIHMNLTSRLQQWGASKIFNSSFLSLLVFPITILLYHQTMSPKSQCLFGVLQVWGSVLEKLLRVVF